MGEEEEEENDDDHHHDDDDDDDSGAKLSALFNLHRATTEFTIRAIGASVSVRINPLNLVIATDNNLMG